jgi:2-hydroxy-3-oxopropionate reductase
MKGTDTLSSPVLGVLGLGAMGRPMAEHLLRGHGQLALFSRSLTPDDPLIADGASFSATPADLAARCDAILLMLPDLPQVEEMLDGPDGLLAGRRGPLLLLIGSTSSPTGVRALHARLTKETDGEVRVVDTPVSGGEDGAAAGTLSIMIGGDDDDARLAATLLKPCGQPVHLGPLGAGEVAKACNQLVVASTIMALGEATVLAERSGIDPQQPWDLLGGGYAGSNLLASRQEKLISGDDSPSGPARYMLKDLAFAQDVADATDTRAVILPAVQAAFQEIVESGLGDRDIAVTRRFIDKR